MCFCNFCRVQKGYMKRCACTLASYCSDECYHKDLARAKGHMRFCIVMNPEMAVFQRFLIPRTTSESCLNAWQVVEGYDVECVGPLNMSIGKEASHLLEMNQCELARRMRDLHEDANGNAPDRYTPRIVWKRKVDGFPGRVWFLNRMIMLSGTVVPFLVCPPGTKSISLICKGQCTYVILLNRIGTESICLHMCNYREAQAVLYAVSNLSRLINLMAKKNNWGSENKINNAPFKGLIDGTALNLLEHLFYRVKDNGDVVKDVIATLPTSPIILYVKIIGYKGVKTPESLDIPNGMTGIYHTSVMEENYGGMSKNTFRKMFQKIWDDWDGEEEAGAEAGAEAGMDPSPCPV